MVERVASARWKHKITEKTGRISWNYQKLWTLFCCLVRELCWKPTRWFNQTDNFTDTETRLDVLWSFYAMHERAKSFLLSGFPSLFHPRRWLSLVKVRAASKHCLDSSHSSLRKAWMNFEGKNSLLHFIAKEKYIKASSKDRTQYKTEETTLGALLRMFDISLHTM